MVGKRTKFIKTHTKTAIKLKIAEEKQKKLEEQ
jgi:hypothetical protein